MAASTPACGGASSLAGREGIPLLAGSTVSRASLIVSERRAFAPVSVSGGGSASSPAVETATGPASAGGASERGAGSFVATASLLVLGSGPALRCEPHAVANKHVAP